MINDFKMIKVKDSEIGEEPLGLLSWGRDGSRLKKSLAAIGQTTPLILWDSPDGLLLVCGARRRLALLELGVSEFNAWVAPAGLGPEKAAVLAVEDNLGHRDFNEAEKVLAVKYLSRYLTEQEITREFARKIGFPPRLEHLVRLRTLGDLESAGLDLLAAGRMDSETAEMLMEISSEDRRAVLDVLTLLNPGRNKTKLIVAWLTESARRDDVAVASVLSEPEFVSILEEPKLNVPVKEEKIRDLLRKRRFPVLYGLERRRAELLRSLDLPPDVRLILPSSFEGLEFKMEVVFKDPEEFGRSVENAARLAGDDNFRALLELG